MFLVTEAVSPLLRKRVATLRHWEFIRLVRSDWLSILLLKCDLHTRTLASTWYLLERLSGPTQTYWIQNPHVTQMPVNTLGARI